MLSFLDLPGHVRLMLLAARAQLTASEIDQIQILARSSLDWNEFLAVTTHHRLAPLVFETLDRIQHASNPASSPAPSPASSPAPIPDAIFENLHRQATANAFQALRAAAELHRITTHFAHARIPLTLLKGISLSQLLFSTPNARHVGDLDLLTTPHRLPDQIALLAELCYTRTNPKARLTPHRLASYTSFWKDFTFENPDSGFALDLHWRLFNHRLHPANRILDKPTCTTSTVFGIPLRVLSPQDQFLHIAAHGIADAWMYLKSLADLAAFLRLFTPSELDRALLRARQLGLLPQVSAAIHLANDWMGAAILNPHLLPASHPLALEIRRRTESLLLRHHFKPRREHPTPGQWLALEFKLVPGLRSLAELTRRFIWRPRIWSRVDLPDSLFWIYPLLALVLPFQPHPAEE